MSVTGLVYAQENFRADHIQTDASIDRNWNSIRNHLLTYKNDAEPTMLTDADRMHTVIKYVVLTDSVDAMQDTRQHSTHHSNAKRLVLI